MSDDRQRVPGSEREGHREHEEEPQHEGGLLDGPDRLFRLGQVHRHRQRIMRKKAGGGEPQVDEAHVSQPHESAEQEADQVADHVADELHDDGARNAGDKPHAKEPAPAIGAKLQPGAISLAAKPGANANQLALPGIGGGAKDNKKKEPNKPQRDPKDPAFIKAKARVAPVAAQLQAALQPNQQGRVTMGAGVTESGAVIVATSEATLRPTVAEVFKSTGAQLAKGAAGVHAEDKIIANAGKGLVAVAAGRPICESCENNILGAGALPASACKSGKVY